MATRLKALERESRKLRQARALARPASRAGAEANSTE
jgi:hypothetical protein